MTNSDLHSVLYSRKDLVWKLSDFGFTSEATSRSLLSSKDGRGTPSYRAPELLAFSDTPAFNKKVDIWSMGCIMYELTLRKRAFGNDYATMEYKMEYRTSQKPISVILDESFGEQCKESIVTNITSMIQIEPSRRPSATDLVEEFTRQFQSTQLQPHHNVHVHENFLIVPPLVPPKDVSQLQNPMQPTLQVQQDAVTWAQDSPLFSRRHDTVSQLQPPMPTLQVQQAAVTRAQGTVSNTTRRAALPMTPSKESSVQIPQDRVSATVPFKSAKRDHTIVPRWPTLQGFQAPPTQSKCQFEGLFNFNRFH